LADCTDNFTRTLLTLFLFRIRNIGEEQIEISDIFTSEDAFGVSVQQLLLEPRGEDTLQVWFRAADWVDYADELIIISDSQSDPRISIPIRAYASNIKRRELIPARAGIVRVYPNPFNTAALVDFYLEVPGKVTLSAYTSGGVPVVHHLLSSLSAGKHSLSWDGAHLPAGTYWLKLSSLQVNDIRKVVILK